MEKGEGENYQREQNTRSKDNFRKWTERRLRKRNCNERKESRRERKMERIRDGGEEEIGERRRKRESACGGYPEKKMRSRERLREEIKERDRKMWRKRGELENWKRKRKSERVRAREWGESKRGTEKKKIRRKRERRTIGREKFEGHKIGDREETWKTGERGKKWLWERDLAEKRDRTERTNMRNGKNGKEEKIAGMRERDQERDEGGEEEWIQRLKLRAVEFGREIVGFWGKRKKQKIGGRERDFQEDRRIKREKNVGERTRERLSGGGRKDYKGLKRKQQ